MDRADAVVLMVPVSVGEVVDKITILRIKSSRMADGEKLANVRNELAALERVLDEAFRVKPPELDAATNALQAINERLWEIEDDIREREHAGDFGADFVALARQVYLTNDERARVKRGINVALGSALIEEKSYRGSA